jgi:uncharacterized protein (TIGR03067 family)
MRVNLVALLVFAVACNVAQAEEAAKVLAGKWPITAATEAGHKWSKDFKPQPRLTFKHTQFAARFGPAILFEGTVAVDATKTPKTIDLKCSGARYEGKTLQGIYEVKGDVLQMCFAESDGKRPSAFASTRENKNYLFECDRRKADWWPAWNYDKKEERSFPTVSSGVFITKDSVKKVSDYYEGILGARATVMFDLNDGMGNGFFFDAGPSRIVAGGSAELHVGPEQATLFGKPYKVKFDPDVRLAQAGRDAEAGALRVYTQETSDYTITVVITRDRDDKETRIVVTFITR